MLKKLILLALCSTCLALPAVALPPGPAPAPAPTSSGPTEVVVNSTGLLNRVLPGLTDSIMHQQSNALPGASTFVGPMGQLRRGDRGDQRSSTNPNVIAGPTSFDEATAFATGSTRLPGTYLGGTVRISGLVGSLGFWQRGESVSKGAVSAVLYGTGLTWSVGSLYAASQFIGFAGDHDGQVGAFRFSSGISGTSTTWVIGNILDFGAVKLDLRGGLQYAQTDLNAIVTQTGGLSSADAYKFSGLTSVKLFTVINTANGAFRPYVLGTYRGAFDQDLRERTTANALHFKDAANLGRVELGFDMIGSQITFGASVYTETSELDQAIGGRFGASWKLN